MSSTIAVSEFANWLGRAGNAENMLACGSASRTPAVPRQIRTLGLHEADE